MGTITTNLKIDADARQAVAGLKPLQTSLEETRDDAEATEEALKDLDKNYRIDLNDAAIRDAREEIEDLQREMRENLELGADTRVAQRRIRELKSAIRLLDAQDIDLDVDVDSTDLLLLNRSMDTLRIGAGKVPGVLAAVGTAATGLTFGLAGIGIAAGAAVVQSLKLADSLAQSTIAFTQFLGSGKKATQFLNQLQVFAKATPFEFPELVDSSKQLLAFGIASEEIVPILTSLGDAAALTGVQVADLTSIWGQMEAKGRVANEELLQLTERGIPAYQILAEKMGLTTAEVQKMAEEGKLLSDTTLPKLKAGLDETFGGGMVKQSQTLSGLWSTMKDTLGQLGTRIGEAFTPIAAEQIDNVTKGLETWVDVASENKERIAVVFSEITASILDFAADVTIAFAGVLDSTAALFEAFDTIEDIAKVVSPQLGALFRNTDFSDAAANLRTVSDGLSDVSGGLRDASDEALETGKRVGEAFAESDRIQRTKNDIRDVRAELKSLREEPKRWGLDVDIKEAKEHLNELKDRLDDESEPRDILIRPKMVEQEYARMVARLAELEKDRVVDVWIEGHQSGPGGQGGLPATAPSAAPGGRGGRTDRMAPGTKPTVNVYVDGRQIPARADTPRRRRVA
jgi:tape measure domain-containing protein